MKKLQRKEYPMNLNDLIANLEKNQFNSKNPTEFEKDLAEAFKFLGFETVHLGKSSTTDVLITANIGRHKYKATVEAKTSKNEKIVDALINWDSILDHKKNENADYSIIVGCDFAKHNLTKRAEEKNVTLLKTEQLIKILEQHAKYPFSLLELKEVFNNYGLVTQEVNKILKSNSKKRTLIENVNTFVDYIIELQNDEFGYFSVDSLLGISELRGIKNRKEKFESLIDLLKNPLINAVVENEYDKNKFIMTQSKKDLANLFMQLSQILYNESKNEETQNEIPEIEKENPKIEPEKIQEKKELGTPYFKWVKEDNKIRVFARKNKEYDYSCSIENFTLTVQFISDVFKKEDVIYTAQISKMVKKDENIAKMMQNKEYIILAVVLTMAVLEIEDFIRWTGSKHPKNFKLNAEPKEIKQWLKKEFKDFM